MSHPGTPINVVLNTACVVAYQQREFLGSAPNGKVEV